VKQTLAKRERPIADVTIIDAATGKMVIEIEV